MKADEVFEKALLAIKDRNFDRAAWLLVEAIKKKPDFAEAWVVRGNVVHAQGRFFDSLLHYDRALQINPKLHDAWCNRGIAFSDIGLWDSASECFQKSLALMPAVEPYINLANMECHRMRLPEAEAAYRAALKLEPGNYDAHINLGLTLLGQGRWQEGYPEYAWRHRNTPYPPRARRLFPPWDGSSLAGKTILLYPEQGFGDEILFMRFAAMVKRESPGARVVLEVRPPLVRLARSLAGVDDIVLMGDEIPESIGSIDCSCALVDVPFFLGLGPQDVTPAGRHHYFDASMALICMSPGLDVGLCWSSGQRPLQPETAATSAAKSIHLEWLRGLEMPGVNLVSLQKEHGDQKLVAEMGLIDPMADVNDFADTAAIIARLDLVISVDTAVAHLAGAMGKPVWNLVRFNAYWPWLEATDRTPWYPSMKIYRQPQLGDWDDPIKRVVRDLAALVASGQKDAA